MVDASALSVFDGYVARLATDLQRAHFDVSSNHLDQALRGLGREEWESANAQTRAFLESVCDEVAYCLSTGEFYRRRLGPRPASPKGGEARKLIESSNFVEPEEAAVLRAVSSWLHRRGAHPGRSGRVDAMAKMQTAAGIASVLLERHRLRTRAEEHNTRWMEESVEGVFGSIASGTPVGMYNAPDFDIVRLDETGEDDDSDVLLACERFDSIDDAWLERFAEHVREWSFAAGLVVTNRPVDVAGAVVEVADGLWRTQENVVVAMIVRDDPDGAHARLESARRLLVPIAVDWLLRRRNGI